VQLTSDPVINLHLQTSKNREPNIPKDQQTRLTARGLWITRLRRLSSQMFSKRFQVFNCCAISRLCLPYPKATEVAFKTLWRPSVTLEFAVAQLFMAGPCFGRLWQVFRCSIVATQTAFIKCLATPTTGALDWAVPPSTRFSLLEGL
jgi:hypothetical protein